MPEDVKTLISLNKQLNDVVASVFSTDIKGKSNKDYLSAFVLGKSFKTHEAILILAEKGFGEDAFILGRTLFELMVMYLYILKDTTDDTLMRYVNHDWVTRKQFYNHIETNNTLFESLNKTMDAGVSHTETLANIDSEYKRVMGKYNYKGNEWSDKNISEMADAIGRTNEYKTVYKLQCLVSHTNARSMNEYVSDKNGEMIFNKGPNWEMTKITLVSSLDFFRAIIDKVNQELSWSIENQLESIYEQFIKEVTLYSKVKQN